MNSTGRIGLTMICSSVPTSRSRTTAKAVRLTTWIRVSVPMTPGMKNQRSVKPFVEPRPFLERGGHRWQPPRRLALAGAARLVGLKLRDDLADIAERDQRGIGIGAVDRRPAAARFGRCSGPGRSRHGSRSPAWPCRVSMSWVI